MGDKGEAKGEVEMMRRGDAGGGDGVGAERTLSEDGKGGEGGRGEERWERLGVQGSWRGGRGDRCKDRDKQRSSKTGTVTVTVTVTNRGGMDGGGGGGRKGAFPACNVKMLTVHCVTGAHSSLSAPLCLFSSQSHDCNDLGRPARDKRQHHNTCYISACTALSRPHTPVSPDAGHSAATAAAATYTPSVQQIPLAIFHQVAVAHASLKPTEDRFPLKSDRNMSALCQYRTSHASYAYERSLCRATSTA
eukprot:1071059-Rhodomonas_salina.1